MSGLYVILAFDETSNSSKPQEGYKVGDPILHIELRRWADIVLIAPCSANTLAKIAHGICDNLAVSHARRGPARYIELYVDISTTCTLSEHADICVPGYEHPYVSTPFDQRAFTHNPKRHRV